MWPDHPRACGANPSMMMRSPPRAGSSPRMRGKHRGRPHQRHYERIIPAHAGQTAYRTAGVSANTDHPRACGANRRLPSMCQTMIGSSTRMRGKRALVLLLGFCGRIIPAHAGQTLAFAKSSSAWPDHPRACGANWNNLVHGNYRNGSSPRMRGKLIERRERDHILRIIPAHAGQTAGTPARGRARPDHPRACGANSRFFCSCAAACGSSPRMRGKHGPSCRVRQGNRIIPAHAGQTASNSPTSNCATDHPRACGANQNQRVRSLVCSGSSPRMRGKRARRRVRRGRGRIIPAHAGQTRRYCVWSCADPDHPRACGANAGEHVGGAHAGGSSPRMRGKPLKSNVACVSTRIIPAHAGQTSRESSTSSPASDHPRACGANCVRRGPACLCTGSSPRMRGKRSQSSLVTSSSRIIPAHAGQTRSDRRKPW